jgi:predicted RNA binding protein YcfA (HicA-like mRNA interferase family)
VASAKKELKEIVKAAEQQGWRVKTTKKGHLMFFAPDGVNKVSPRGGRRATIGVLTTCSRS